MSRGVKVANALTLYEVDRRVATLTMNDPARRNALSSRMMREMLAAVRSAQDDPAVRVLIIAAAGPVFSSGHDLRELRDGDREDSAILFAACTELMESLRLMGKPTIAQVQGLATAAGCQLAAACDLAAASEDAAFATPGVDIGLFCTTPSVALSRAVPTKTAMRMLLTGEPISAREALAAGLVNEVAPPEELRAAAMSLALKLAEAPPSAVSMGKTAFYKHIALDFPQAYDLAQRVMVENLQRPDAREGISAFLEKRKPAWRV